MSQFSNSENSDLFQSFTSNNLEDTIIPSDSPASNTRSKSRSKMSSNDKDLPSGSKKPDDDPSKDQDKRGYTSTPSSNKVFGSISDAAKHQRFQLNDDENQDDDVEDDNPLNNTFPPDKDLVPEDEPVELPNYENPTQVQQDEINLYRVINELKRKRSTIYSSITKMSKNLMKKMADQGDYKWRELLDNARRSEDKLSDITQNLQDVHDRLGIEVPPEEINRMADYLKTSNDTISRISSYNQAKLIGIPDHVNRVKQELYAKEAELSKGTSSTNDLMKMMTHLMTKIVDTTTRPDTAKADFSGMTKIKAPKFSGKEADYYFFKHSFEAQVEGRGIAPLKLALYLRDHLTGTALELVQKHLDTRIDEHSYQNTWDLLEERYGGEFREDAHVMRQFKEATPLKNFSYKELERMYDVFTIQSRYYLRVDPQALKSEKSYLTKEAKMKFTTDQSQDFLKFCYDNSSKENFETLLKWIRHKFDMAQRGERGYLKVRDEKDPRKRFPNSNHHMTDDHQVSEDEDSNAQESDNESVEEQVFWVQKGDGKMERWKGKPSWQKKPSFPPKRSYTQGNSTRKTKAVLKPTDICALCKTKHEMSACPKFMAMNYSKRKLVCRDNILCFHCLSTKHFVKDCKVNMGKLCEVDNCQRYHHELLHQESGDTTNFLEDDEHRFDPLTSEESAQIYHVAEKGAISLQTIVCNIASKGANYRTVGLIDTGSTITCIDEDFARKLKLPFLLTREGRELNLLDRTIQLEGEQHLVDMQLTSIDNLTHTTIQAWTVKNMAARTAVVDWSERKKDFPHLQKINFPKLPENPKIQILFGLNNTHLFRATDSVMNESNVKDPIAIRTFLGWTCIGISASQKALTKDPTVYFTNVILKPLSSQNSD